MKFQPIHFDPLGAGGTAISQDGTVAFAAGPEPTDVYLYKPTTILALNVALATSRPLLILGEPGSGKTTLARNAAGVLGWWFFHRTITSRVQASDLLWTFDTLRRLNDAREGDLRDKQFYVDPGVLWWAFDPVTAANRGGTELPEKERAKNPGSPPPRKPNTTPGNSDPRPEVVVLLDEIDKADPDVPNDLLEPFDVRSFTVRETNDAIQAQREVLLLLTSNGERELPPAFLRRCTTITVDPPTEQWFVEVANRKFGEERLALHRAVARRVMELRQAARKGGLRQPSMAEYLDTLRVCRELEVTPKSKVWKDLVQTVLWKHETPPDLGASATDER